MWTLSCAEKVLIDLILPLWSEQKTTVGILLVESNPLRPMDSLSVFGVLSGPHEKYRVSFSGLVETYIELDRLVTLTAVLTNKHRFSVSVIGHASSRKGGVNCYALHTVHDEVLQAV